MAENIFIFQCDRATKTPLHVYTGQSDLIRSTEHLSYRNVDGRTLLQIANCSVTRAKQMAHFVRSPHEA